MSTDYNYKDSIGATLSVWRDGRGGVEIYSPRGDKFLDVYLPEEPAELHKLIEAIMGNEIKYIQYAGGMTHYGPSPDYVGGRKVAEIIYEDELPEADRDLHGRQVGVGGIQFAGPDFVSGRTVTAEGQRREALKHIVYARHLEARDAEKQAEQSQVEAVAKGLFETADGNGNSLTWPPSMLGSYEWWMLRARRAYELGARAPKGGA